MNYILHLQVAMDNVHKLSLLLLLSVRKMSTRNIVVYRELPMKLTSLLGIIITPFHWSGVADLSARLYTRGRVRPQQYRLLARWFGVISWQRSRKCAFSLVRSLPCFVERFLPAFSARRSVCERERELCVC